MRLILFEFDRYFDSIRFFLKNDSKRRSAIPVLVKFVAERLSVCRRFRQQRKTTLPQEIISSKIGVERGRKPYARPCFSASRKRVYADVIASHNYNSPLFLQLPRVKKRVARGKYEGNARDLYKNFYETVFVSLRRHASIYAILLKKDRILLITRDIVIYKYIYIYIKLVVFCRFVAWQLSSIARNKVSFTMYQRQRGIYRCSFRIIIIIAIVNLG